MARSAAPNWRGLVDLWTTRQAIGHLPAEARARVEAAEKELRAVIERYGDDGIIALAMVGLEVAYEE